MHDEADVTGSPAAFAPTGTVTYYFSSDGGATYSVFDTEAVGTDSISTGSLAAGSYSFYAVYSGDSNYSGSTSALEPFSGTQGTSTLVTQTHLDGAEDPRSGGRPGEG